MCVIGLKSANSLLEEIQDNDDSVEDVPVDIEDISIHTALWHVRELKIFAEMKGSSSLLENVMCSSDLVNNMVCSLKQTSIKDFFIKL